MSDEGFSVEPGKRLQIPERVQKRERQLRGPGSDFRESVSELADRLPVNPANENISPDTLAGAIGTFIVYSIEDYLPVRLGASVDVLNVEEVNSGEYEYTINVNSAIEGQARFKAILQAGTGVTSLWVDTFEVTDFEKIKERPARDTYQYKIRIKQN
jgi:hypothetical protein